MSDDGIDIPSFFSIPSSSSTSIVPCNQDVLCTTNCETGTEFDLQSLDNLGSSFEKLIIDSDYDYRDAEIEVEGISVGVNCCILAARSEFFHKLFKSTHKNPVYEGKPKYVLSELVPHGRIGYESFVVVMSYLYTGNVKPPPLEVSTCVHESCAHDACGPAINYAVEIMYASATFQIQGLVMLFQQRLLNYVDKALAEDVIPILKVASHFQLDPLLTRCIQRIAQSDLDDIDIEKELPFEIVDKVNSIRVEAKKDNEQESSPFDNLHQKRIKKIHRALDSHDIPLLELLLDESNISLDAAYALHYAAAYCNPKLVNELLTLGNADINLCNSRGYTVLHVAARRKDPSIILGLLEKGASASATTRDGQTAVTMCQRLTRLKDFNEVISYCQETNKDRLCIEVLEREMCRIPLAGNMSTTLVMEAEDFYMSLLYLENRVALARRYFPLEATLAMEVAHVETTEEFDGIAAADLKGVDLSELSYEEREKLQLRRQALKKTVETGRRFFPNCSKFLDKLSEDDNLGLLLLENGTPDEQRMKKRRYKEIEKEILKAYNKDKSEKCSGVQLTASSRSASPESSMMQKCRRK